jgi:hypothetical protein
VPVQAHRPAVSDKSHKYPHNAPKHPANFIIGTRRSTPHDSYASISRHLNAMVVVDSKASGVKPAGRVKQDVVSAQRKDSLLKQRLSVNQRD